MCDEPGTLIKFGQYEHLAQLQESGILYLNSLEYFWGIEDKGLRGDPLDCLAQVRKGPEVVLGLPDGKSITMNGLWTYREFLHNSNEINIYCMYALRPDTGSFPIDKRNFEFGNHALVLLNARQFLDRITLNLNSAKIPFRADLVEYVEDEYVGHIGPFKKRKAFSYQSEWRLVCYNGPGKERTIEIGSIKDISAIIPSREINTQMTIRYD